MLRRRKTLSATSTEQPANAADKPPSSDGAPSAVRGGSLLLASGVVANACNYLFAVLAGRILGPTDYGVLTALLALTVIVGLPVIAVQVALARDVSFRDNHGDIVGSDALLQATARAAFLATGLLALASLILMVPVAWVLNIDDIWLVGLSALIFLPLVLTAVVTGEIQARQRYGELAVVTAAPSVVRLVVFGASLLVGATLVGALWASVVGALVGLLLPAWWARGAFRPTAVPRPSLRPFIAGLWPVIVGMVGITALTNVDLLIVKGRLSAFDAGLYGAASVLGKIAFFVPTAIVGVIFPRVAMRRAEGRDTSDMLGRALIATIAFCVLLFGLYAVAGTQVVDLAFGAEYDGSVPLLVPFGIGMTCFSIANVLVSYHLARGDRRFATVLALGAAIQLAALLAVPAGLLSFIWVNAAVGIGLLALHEVIQGSSLPAIAMGFRSLTGSSRDFAERAWTTGAARRVRVVEVVLTLAGFTALAVALTWPLTPNLGSAIFGMQGDSFGAIHWLWSLPTEGGLRLTGASPVDLTGYPFGWLRGNGVNAQWLLVYGPAYFLSSLFGPIVAYNLVIISGLALSGGAMYWLARYIGTSRMVAAWAGIVFTMFPWHMERAQYHGSLVHLEWFPILIIAVLAWRKRPDARRTVLLALSMLAMWLTSGYYGLIALLLVAVLLTVVVILEGPAWGWLSALARAAMAAAASTAAAGTVFAASLLGGGADSAAPARGVTELQTYGARWWEWIVPPGASRALGGSTATWLLDRQHGSNTSETGLYVGVLTLLLAATWIVWRIVRRHQMTRQARYLLVALPAGLVAGLAFSLPHPLTVFGVNLPSPAYLIYAVTPQFRVSSRMVVLVMVTLIPMAALGLEVLRRTLTRRMPDDALRRATGVAGVGFVCVASAAELTVVPGVPVTDLSTPPEYAAVRSLPSDGAIAEYPLTGPSDPQMAQYLLWQTRHGRPLLNGAPENTFAGAVREGVSRLSDPGTAPSLAAMGIQGVVVRPPDSAGDPPPGFEALASEADGVAVWKVTARPSAVSAMGEGFEPGEPRPNGLPMHWLSGKTGRVNTWAPRETTVRATFDVGSWSVPRRGVVRGGSGKCVFTAAGTQERSITVRIPAGFATLDVSAEPGAGRLPDGRSASLYMSGWSLRPAGAADACVTARPLTQPEYDQLGLVPK